MLPSHPKTTAPQTGHPTVRVGSGWLRSHLDGAIFPSLRSSAPMPNPTSIPAPARRQHPIPSAPITHRNVSQQTASTVPATAFTLPTAPVTHQNVSQQTQKAQQTGLTVPTTAFTPPPALLTDRNVSRHTQQTAITVPTTAFMTTRKFQYTPPSRFTPDPPIPSQGVGIRVPPSGDQLPQPPVQTSQVQLRNQPELQAGRLHHIPARKTASVINDIDRRQFLDMLSHQESVHNRIVVIMASLAFTDYLCKSHESGVRPGAPGDLDRYQRTHRVLQDQLRDFHSENERIEMTMHVRFPFLQGLLNGSGLFSAMCKTMFP